MGWDTLGTGDNNLMCVVQWTQTPMLCWQKLDAMTALAWLCKGLGQESSRLQLYQHLAANVAQRTVSCLIHDVNIIQSSYYACATCALWKKMPLLGCLPKSAWLNWDVLGSVCCVAPLAGCRRDSCFWCIAGVGWSCIVVTRTRQLGKRQSLALKRFDNAQDGSNS